MSTTLPVKLLHEIVLLPPQGFNFANRLQAGEVLTGTPAVTVSVYSGVDPNPAAMLSGPATLNSPNVLQKFTGGVPGTIYTVLVGCNTSLGQFLEQFAYLVVMTDTAASPPTGAIILLPGGAPVLLPGGGTIAL